MLDRKTCTKGLQMIADHVGHPMTKERFDAYYLALAEESDPMEWVEFTRVATKRTGWKFIPSVPDLLDALRVFRGGPALAELQSEAAAAYERVIAASDYTAEGGAFWSYRGVAERCGKAAADAFLAAGGHHAFATTWDEAKRRERFIAAYQDAARTLPETRLLPAGAEPKQLTGADDVRVSPNEAREAIRKITGMVPAPKAETSTRLGADEWEARKRALQEQARVIAQENPQEEHVQSGHDAAGG